GRHHRRCPRCRRHAQTIARSDWQVTIQSRMIGLLMLSPMIRSVETAGGGAIAPADVAALLGDWPARGSGSLATRLAFSLRSRILAGLLPPGATLPPERRLAQALAVSRSTLVAALDLLRSEGLVTSRQGS